MDDIRVRVVAGSLMAVKRLDADYDPQVHGALGITEPGWRALTADKPWTARDKQLAQRAMDAAITGGMELAGIPTDFHSVEFVAACIVCLVDPINWQVAATFGRAMYRADEMLQTESTAEQAMMFQSPPRLFTLVKMIASEMDGELPFQPRWALKETVA